MALFSRVSCRVNNNRVSGPLSPYACLNWHRKHLSEGKGLLKGLTDFLSHSFFSYKNVQRKSYRTNGYTQTRIEHETLILNFVVFDTRPNNTERHIQNQNQVFMPSSTVQFQIQSWSICIWGW